MLFQGISIWGILLVLLFVGLALSLFWLIDRKMLSRSLRALTSLVVQLSLAGVYVWGLYKLDSWVVNILWLLLMSAIVAYVCLQRVKLAWQRLLPHLFAAVAGGSAVLGGSMLLVLQLPPAKYLFVPVMALLVGSLLTSTTEALRTYIICMRYTERHRLFLQANGASHLEAIMPSVRRALRAALMPHLRTMSSPMLLALPLLACGMLMGGCPVGTAFVTTLLVALSSYAAIVLTTVLMLWLSDRMMFDGYGNFIVR